MNDCEAIGIPLVFPTRFPMRFNSAPEVVVAGINLGTSTQSQHQSLVAVHLESRRSMGISGS